MRSLTFILVVFVTFLLGAARYPSPIPLPKTVFIDLDPHPCDQRCLEEHLQRKEYFSFMAKIKREDISAFKEEYRRLAQLLNAYIPTARHTFGLAVFYEPRLKSYANKVVLSAFSYFASQNTPVEIKSYPLGPEEPLEFQIERSGADVGIALLTYAEEEKLRGLNSPIPLFIPTLNKEYLDVPVGDNIYFGGVNYKDQLEIIKNLATKDVTLFYLKRSPLSLKLTRDFSSDLSKNVKAYPVDDSSSNLGYLLRRNTRINRSSLLFNTPIVKTSLILSQLRLYRKNPKAKLSTQINYNPKLFHLTQPKDRKDFILTTSFFQPPEELEGLYEVFDDGLSYDWVSFSTMVGLDAFRNVPKRRRAFPIDFVDNQLLYPISVKRTLPFSFEEVEVDQESMEESLPVSRF